MRRAIAAAVTSGLVLGGALATPAFATAQAAGKANDGARTAAAAKPPAGKSANKAIKKAKKPAEAKTAAATVKTVVYQGYEFQVPASWPVYRLDEHPQTCVRYDVHAVYLGAPGADMKCPAGLIGRTQAVSFVPGSNVAVGSGAGSASQPQGAGGTAVRKLTAVDATITQNASHQELQVALGPGGAGATLTGTYGSDPAAIKAGARHAAARAGRRGDDAAVGEAAAAARLAAVRRGADRGDVQEGHQGSVARKAAPEQAPGKKAPAAASSPNPSATYTNWHGVPAGFPVEVIQPPPKPKPTPKPTPTPTPPPTPPPPPVKSPPPRTVGHQVSGFDTCTAPSQAAMKAWKSKYSAVGIYIGGANSACAYGNLSASWVQASAAMGYGMLPTYVGPQAPCWGFHGALINASKAASQGTAAAKDAISDAKFFKLPAGSPVYYDMEAYGAGTSCKNAVLSVPRRLGPPDERRGLRDRRVLQPAVRHHRRQRGGRGQDGRLHRAQRGLVRAVGQRRPAHRRRRRHLASGPPEQAVRRPGQPDHRRGHAEHRPRPGGRPGGSLTRGSGPRLSRRVRPNGARTASAGQKGIPVRVNGPGLISSRHGPTQ